MRSSSAIASIRSASVVHPSKSWTTRSTSRNGAVTVLAGVGLMWTTLPPTTDIFGRRRRGRVQLAEHERVRLGTGLDD
jgi:hypothetical protein